MPSNQTFYLQPCPVCSRPLRVSVQLLGKSAQCGHCTASFIARDHSYGAASHVAPISFLQQRDNALLGGE